MVGQLDVANTPYPYIGLLVDSTTTKICQPGGPFAKVKPYYYALLLSFPSRSRTQLPYSQSRTSCICDLFGLKSVASLLLIRSKTYPFWGILHLSVGQMAGLQITLQKHSLVEPSGRAAMHELKCLNRSNQGSKFEFLASNVLLKLTRDTKK